MKVRDEVYDGSSEAAGLFRSDHTGEGALSGLNGVSSPTNGDIGGFSIAQRDLAGMNGFDRVERDVEVGRGDKEDWRYGFGSVVYSLIQERYFVFQ